MAFSNEDLPNRPIPENDVKKPSMFVFKDMEDYQKNRKNVDAKYNAGHKVKVVKKSSVKSVQKVRHKKLGEGTVERKGEFIVVNFASVGRKQLNEKVCIEKGLIEEV